MIRRWEVIAIYPGTGAVYVSKQKHLTRRAAQRYRDLIAMHGEVLHLKSELHVRRRRGRS